MMQNDQPFGLPASSTVSAFIQRVYSWMAIGLIVTGVSAFWTAGNAGLIKALMHGGIYILFFMEVGLVWWLSASIAKISAQTATVAFLVYSFLNGLNLSFAFLYYTGASIALVFFMTAGTFAAVSMFGWATKSDMSSMGGFFLMGLIGVIIASVVNAFLRSPALDYIISYVGLAIFIGLTAYDTQKLKRIHQAGMGTSQVAILGALALYLDFINMFLFLLRLFGRRNN